MANLCIQLRVDFDLEVIDKTGITGIFNIHFDWPPAESQSATATADTDPGASEAAEHLRRQAGIEASPSESRAETRTDQRAWPNP